MDMYSALLLEKARREKNRRQEAITGTPEIIEEMHPDIGVGQRLAIKNFGADPEKSAKYLEKETGLQTRVYDGRILAKRQNEKQWRTLDPDAEGFDGLGEFARDVGDVAYDVGSGVVEGVGTAAAAAVPVLFGGAGLSLPAATAVSSGLGGASEALRQKIGQMVGVNEDVNLGDVAVTGALSGAIPLVPSAVGRALSGTKAAGKGAVKFLTGVTDENLDVLKNQGESLLQNAEKYGVRDRLEEKAKAVQGLGEKQAIAIAEQIENAKSQFNIADDELLKERIGAEIGGIEGLARSEGRILNKSESKQVGQLRDILDNIDKTKPVREVLAKSPRLEGEALTSAAFPNVAQVDELAQSLPTAMREKFNDAITDIGKLFGDAYAGKKMSVEFMDNFKNDYIAKRFPPASERTGAENSAINSINKWFDNTFKIDNRGNLKVENIKTPSQSYDYDYRAQIDVSPEDMSKLGLERDKYLPQSENFDVLSDRTQRINQAARTLRTQSPKQTVHEAITGVKAPEPNQFVLPKEELSLDRVQRLKNRAVDMANYANSNTFNPTKDTDLTNFARGLEREIASKMDDALSGANASNKEAYKAATNAREYAYNLFGSENKSKNTVKRALKGDPTTIRQIEQIDNIIGTDYSRVIREAAEAADVSKMTQKQQSIINDANKYYEDMAENLKAEDFDDIQKLRQMFKDADSASEVLAQARAGNSAFINDAVSKIEEKYGKDAGESVYKLINELDAINYFANPKSKKLFGTTGANVNEGELKGVASGAGGALGWSLGSAYAAQTGSNIFRGIASQAQVRQALREYLPKYWKAEKGLKGLSDTAKRELEKEISGTLFKRRDLLREAAKKISTVEDRG